MEKSGLSKLV